MRSQHQNNYLQTEIDWVHHRENNSESQSILEANRPYLNKKCRETLEILKSGKRLTVYEALVNYGISSLPRRCLDLKKAGYEIKSSLIEGRFKEYFIE